MKKFQRVVSILLLVVLAIPTLSVFAKEGGMRMTISGPGINGEAAIESSDLLMRLEDTGFFGFSDNITFIKPLENPGEGYKITAYLGKSNTIMPFVTMEYYPAEEGAGYVHYTGRIDGESMKLVDEWGRLPANADKTFKRLMDVNQISLQTAVLSTSAVDAVKQPQTQPEVQPANPSSAVTPRTQPPYGTVAIIAAILVIVGAGLIVRKRFTSQRSF